MDSTESGHMPDTYDRLLGALHGLPDVISSKPVTIRTVEPLVGNTQTFIVQTYRQRDQGDTIFVECVAGSRAIRLCLPCKVADAIARQRDQLTAKARSKAAKQLAAERKERGELPAFLKTKKKEAQS